MSGTSKAFIWYPTCHDRCIFLGGVWNKPDFALSILYYIDLHFQKNSPLLQSVSKSWVCHFAVDAEMVSKNQFYHMVRDWFGVKNWPLVAKFLKVATFIEEKLSKKGFGIFSFLFKSFGEKTWNQNSGASFGMTLLFCFQNFVLWSTLKKKFRHRKFKVK